jgi:hypothetical protein
VSRNRRPRAKAEEIEDLDSFAANASAQPRRTEDIDWKEDIIEALDVASGSPSAFHYFHPVLGAD